MKADPFDQRTLLTLQDLELRLARARRGAARASAAQAVADQEARVAQLHRQLVAARTRGQDLQRAIAKSETETARVRVRLARDQEVADSGASARVQREVEHELASLTRRVGELEETEIGLLEEADSVAAEVAELEERETQAQAELVTVRADAAAGADRASHDEEDLVAERDRVAASIPAELLAHFQQLSRGLAVAVAPLTGSQCGGCRLQLPPAEIADLMAEPVDAVIHCEECGCMLVRGAVADGSEQK